MLLEVVQTLTEMNFVIPYAIISSDGGWFVDGTRIWTGALLVACIEACGSRQSRFRSSILEYTWDVHALDDVLVFFAGIASVRLSSWL